jgi:hypothetical protein
MSCGHIPSLFVAGLTISMHCIQPHCQDKFIAIATKEEEANFDPGHPSDLWMVQHQLFMPFAASPKLDRN